MVKVTGCSIDSVIGIISASDPAVDSNPNESIWLTIPWAQDGAYLAVSCMVLENYVSIILTRNGTPCSIEFRRAIRCFINISGHQSNLCSCSISIHSKGDWGALAIHEGDVEIVNSYP